MSIDYEYVVIGGLVLNPSRIDETDLLPDDFKCESYRMVFSTILDMIAANQVIDPITISDKLYKSHPDVQWLPLIGGAAKDCVSPSNISSYAKMLKDDSKRRQAKAICADLLNNIDEETDSSVDNAVKLLMELSRSRQSSEHSISQAMSMAIEIIQTAADTEGTIGIPTGITRLDEVLGGFHDSDLYVIGARPAMGKTAFLLNLMDAHTEQCGLISAEQPAEQIGLRLIAINGRVSAQKMRAGTLEEFDYQKLTNTVSKFHKNNNIWINDRSGISIVDVIRQARKWKHQHDIKALYIDYIQRIKWTDQRLAKWEQVGNVVMSLKELARDLNIPVIALAQVNREVEKRADKQPAMGDLANSSEIEKEADVIMTLYRDEVYDENSSDKGIMEVGVCKNRHGPTGIVRTVWIEQHMRVENYERQYSQ